MGLKTLPPPGSEEAKNLGCCCPSNTNQWLVDSKLNKKAKGFFYIISSLCPVHGIERVYETDDKGLRLHVVNLIKKLEEAGDA